MTTTLLNRDELAICVLQAETRMRRHALLTATTSDPNYPQGHDDQRAGVNLRACKAELGVAKLLGVYWTALGNVGGADIGTHGEVKTTNHPDNPLWVRPADVRNGLAVILVHATTDANDGHVTVRGWIPAAAAPDRATETRNGSYLVPPDALLTAGTLRAADVCPRFDDDAFLAAWAGVV